MAVLGVAGYPRTPSTNLFTSPRLNRIEFSTRKCGMCNRSTIL